MKRIANPTRSRAHDVGGDMRPECGPKLAPVGGSHGSSDPIDPTEYPARVSPAITITARLQACARPARVRCARARGRLEPSRHSATPSNPRQSAVFGRMRAAPGMIEVSKG